MKAAVYRGVNDVRLEDVRQVEPGQPVTVETASSPTAIDGEVLHVTSSANTSSTWLSNRIFVAK